MIRNEFWKMISETWSQKEIIETPSFEEEIDMPEDLKDAGSDEEVDFDDWNDTDAMDDLDNFFNDILNG